jgi:hypothetical protein
VSAAYPASQIVRCPLCWEMSGPVHVGNSVFVHEACGQTFRVVMAQPGKSGARLGALIKASVKWR